MRLRAQRVSLGPCFSRWRKAALLDQRFQLADALTLHITVSACFHSWQRVTREGKARRTALVRSDVRRRKDLLGRAFSRWRYGAAAVAVRMRVCTRLLLRRSSTSRITTLRRGFVLFVAHARGVAHGRREADHEARREAMRAEHSLRVGAMENTLARARDKGLRLGHALVERLDVELMRATFSAWHGAAAAASRAVASTRRIVLRWRGGRMARALRLWAVNAQAHHHQVSDARQCVA